MSSIAWIFLKYRNKENEHILIPSMEVWGNHYKINFYSESKCYMKSWHYWSSKSFTTILGGRGTRSNAASIYERTNYFFTERCANLKALIGDTESQIIFLSPSSCKVGDDKSKSKNEWKHFQFCFICRFQNDVGNYGSL